LCSKLGRLSQESIVMVVRIMYEIDGDDERMNENSCDRQLNEKIGATTFSMMTHSIMTFSITIRKSRQSA
jgi:hypothetical protein